MRFRFESGGHFHNHPFTSFAGLSIGEVPFIACSTRRASPLQHSLQRPGSLMRVLQVRVGLLSVFTDHF